MTHKVNQKKFFNNSIINRVLNDTQNSGDNLCTLTLTETLDITFSFSICVEIGDKDIWLESIHSWALSSSSSSYSPLDRLAAGIDIADNTCPSLISEKGESGCPRAWSLTFDLGLPQRDGCGARD